jgi:hypothetical protein
LRTSRIDRCEVLSVPPQTSFGFSLDFIVVDDVVPRSEAVVLASRSSSDFTGNASWFRSATIPFLSGNRVGTAFCAKIIQGGVKREESRN